MQIGAVLAVIRNNDGFAGLIDILTNLCGFVPERTQELCRKHDFATVAASGKKRPSKKTKEKCLGSKKDTPMAGGYSSGKYSSIYSYANFSDPASPTSSGAMGVDRDSN